MSWLRWAGATALAVTLAACGAESDDGSASNMSFVPRPWIDEGGQTGSLMPACGLSAAAIDNGVPASAPGVVLRTDACNDPNAFDELTVRDASGQPVAFSLVRLPDGSLLINFEGGLTPGRYSIDIGADLSDGGVPLDEDGGLESDASIAPAQPDAGMLEAPADTIDVAEQLPPPQRFGTIERLGGECNAVITFVPDAAVLPFLSVLTVDLQIDDGPIEPLVRPGALPVKNGVAAVRLPTERIDRTGAGYHTLRIVTRIAGASAPLETFLMSVQVPCGYTTSSDVGRPAYEADDGRCAVSAIGSSSGSRASGVLLVGVALYALRRRRRRKRA
jgi:MYXO-CTERM domain-containing protein